LDSKKHLLVLSVVCFVPRIFINFTASSSSKWEDRGSEIASRSGCRFQSIEGKKSSTGFGQAFAPSQR